MNRRWLKWGLVIIVLMIPIIWALNYLNILPIKKLLPQKTTPSTQQTTPIPTKITVKCPLPKGMCTKARPLSYRGINLGVGFSVPPKTTIKAAFSGTLESGTESGGVFKLASHPVKWLKGQGEFKDYTAAYSFYGTTTPIKSVELGGAIATTSAQAFPKEEPYFGANLIFYVTRGDKFGPQVQVEFQD